MNHYLTKTLPNTQPSVKTNISELAKELYQPEPDIRLEKDNETQQDQIHGRNIAEKGIKKPSNVDPEPVKIAKQKILKNLINLGLG